MMTLPKFVRIGQKFCEHRICDIRSEILFQIQQVGICVPAGAKIAIATGSRGISNIHIIIKEVADWVKAQGGMPFIVPAMGSHGNGQAEAQAEILRSMGVTESFVGAPIISSMEVVELPGDGLENHVYMDRHAFEADGTIVVNRIKIHGDFSGETESGLLKMCAIGLGKHAQALEIHQYDISRLRELIVGTAKQVIKHGNIIMGIGILENAYHETMALSALHPDQFEAEEIKMLRRYKQIMPKLPVEDLDILIVDEIGKEISGAGMETKIVGRLRSGAEEPASPRIRYIVTTDLTPVSHGNACGVGIADFITRRLFDKVDIAATNENIVTCRCIEQGRIPIIAEDDRQAVEFAIRSLGNVRIEDLRMIRIKNTLRMDDIFVTPNLLPELRANDDITIFDGQEIDLFAAAKRELAPFWDKN